MAMQNRRLVVPALSGITEVLLASYLLFVVCLLVNAWTAGEPGDWNLIPTSVYIAAWNMGPVRFFLVIAICMSAGIRTFCSSSEKMEYRLNEGIRKERSALCRNARKIDYIVARGTECKPISELPAKEEADKRVDDMASEGQSPECINQIPDEIEKQIDVTDKASADKNKENMTYLVPIITITPLVILGALTISHIINRRK